MTEINNIVKPSGPFGYQERKDELYEEDFYSILRSKNNRRRKIVSCAGCCIAGILIIAVVITTLMITAFHIKAPEIKMNRIVLPQLLLNGTFLNTIPPSTINIVAELSVKNPNIASFKYGNSTTILYYHGIKVGEAHTPSGQAKARRTHNITMSIDVITSRFLADPNFKQDITSGNLTMTCYTNLGGRVKIIKIIKKHIDVELNCTITANIRSQKIVDQTCKKKVSL